jgi:hypothetical protein
VALRPLYKYLGVEGARLTLTNRTFKHAKPSDFNDTEDLTIQSVFPERLEDACKIMYEGFTDTILKNINNPPTCINADMRNKIGLIQQAFRINPDAAEIVKAAKANDVDLLPNLPSFIRRVCSSFAPPWGVLRTRLV